MERLKINNHLNLVMTFASSQGAIHVHSTPISVEVFESHFLILSRVCSELYSKGVGILMGPRVSYLLLKKLAQESGEWHTIERELVNEMIRLTNVLIPGDQGYTTLPLGSSHIAQMLEGDTISRILNQLVFFTCVSHIFTRDQVKELVQPTTGIWGSELSFLNFTDFSNSLRMSIAPENTGEMENISLLPH